MRKLAFKHKHGRNQTPAVIPIPGNADVLQAYVINQKAVNQNVQQALVIVAAQVINVIEAQFGFATNDDSDQLCT